MAGWADEPSVQLVIPADGQYLATARLVMADMASRIGMPMDVIEDLRIAVDEVVTMLTTALTPMPGAVITCTFGSTPEQIQVVVSSSEPVALTPPSAGGYAWIVMEAVCDGFEVEQLPLSTRIYFWRGQSVPVHPSGSSGSEDAGA